MQNNENCNSEDSKNNLVIKNNDQIFMTGMVNESMANKLLQMIKEKEHEYQKEADRVFNLLTDDDNISYKTLNDSFSNTMLDLIPIKESIFREIATKNPLHLYITSYGGQLLSGFKMADIVMQSRIPIYTYGKGYIASAATLPYIYGTKRFMDRNSFFMIHQLKGHNWGKFDELQVEMRNSERFMEKIKQMYAEKSNDSLNDEIDDLLKTDDWWDAKQCLGYNICDEII